MLSGQIEWLQDLKSMLRDLNPADFNLKTPASRTKINDPEAE
jgi:hypothetical protein